LQNVQPDLKTGGNGMVESVLLEVIYHRLKSIADEMETALLKSSFSPIVQEALDATAAVFNAQGQTIAQAAAIPIHLGTLMFSVPQILQAFPTSEMQEGDVFLANDPYSGGTHLPDITVVVPIIYEDEVVALSCSMVHHQDIGAMTPGVPTSATSIYQEGINLPPLKLYDAGNPVKVVHDIIRKNVRTPDMVIGDIRAQVSAGNVGKLRILELLQEHSKELVLTAMNELLNHSETLTRKELEKIPDGTYSFVDYMDNDGIDLDRRIKIQAAVTIHGSEFIVDFSGTSSQVKGPMNCVPSSTWSAVAYVMRVITGASIPSNAGCFRPITVNLPEGSLVNPHPPAATGARTSTVVRVSDVLMGAMAKVIPERLLAASGPVVNPGIYFGGIDPLTGQEYINSELAAGGMGARPTKDGVDIISTDTANLMNVPVEALEMSSPIRILKTGLYDGSGGAGEYRGGLGLEKFFEVLRGTASVTFRGERHYSRPWGLFGGLPASVARGIVVRNTGEKEEIPSKRDLTLNEGDRLYIFTSGGGGYGDPLKRKPDSVLRDVLDRRISIEQAAEDYGVIINRKSMVIDLEKTGQLREERRSQRGAITWAYDRGPEGGKE